MFEEISIKDEDDRQFFNKVKDLINTLSKEYSPKDIYAIRINKWFDHKWLNYSGLGRVKFDAGGSEYPVDTSLDDFWQEKLTLPPFNPKQISDECYWNLDSESKEYNFVRNHEWIHPRKLQSSANNLQKRIINITDSGLFVWFSSHTMANKRGSIMVYLINRENINTWFCAVNLENGFKIDKVKGIDRDKVVDFIEV